MIETGLSICEIKNNGKFGLPGFGKLVKQKRKARTGFNRKMGQCSNLCRLESILAVIRRMPMPPEPRRLEPALNIAGCLALLHAIHLAKPQKARRRKI